MLGDLKRRFFPLVALTLALQLVVSCRTVPEGHHAMTLSENGYQLYGLPPIALSKLPPDFDQFWSELSDNAEAGDQDGIAVRVSLISDEVVRIERTDHGSLVAFDMAIFPDRPSPKAKLKIQPLIAWRPQFGGGDEIEPVLASAAKPLISKLKAEIQRFVPTGQ